MPVLAGRVGPLGIRFNGARSITRHISSVSGRQAASSSKLAPGDGDDELHVLQVRQDVTKSAGPDTGQIWGKLLECLQYLVINAELV